jgi:hypothetical protein
MELLKREGGRLLCIYHKVTPAKLRRDLCRRPLIAALFLISKHQKQTRENGGKTMTHPYIKRLRSRA